MKKSISLKKLWKLYNLWENCIAPVVKSIYHNCFLYYLESELEEEQTIK